MADQITYESFVELIEHMANHKESGSLYVRTDTNRSVLIGLRKGQIEALMAGPKRGIEALKTIMQMSHCTYRLDNSALSFYSKDLPSTNDILMLLKQRIIPAAAETASPSTQPSGGAEINSDQVMPVLCHILHDYLGPAAPVICEDVTDSGATIHTGADLAKAIEELSKEIDSAVEAGEFLNRARQELREFIT